MGLAEEAEAWLMQQTETKPAALDEITERPRLHFRPGNPRKGEQGSWWRSCEHCGHIQTCLRDLLMGSSLHHCQRDGVKRVIYWPPAW